VEPVARRLQRRVRVRPNLSAWLTGPHVPSRLDGLRAELSGLLEGEAARLLDGNGTHLYGGGKRLRTALVLLAGEWGDPDARELPRAALIPELLHAGSLFQDDIVDRAATRRGGAALHRIVGQRGASLFASHLYCLAFNRVLQLTHDVRERAVRAARELCLGQCHELLRVGRPDLSPAEYGVVIGGKTGALFDVAAWLGATVSGAPAHHAQRLADFGRGFGLLFQIVDDLTDLFGDSRESGKGLYRDLQQGVFTLPVLLWLEEQPDNRAARAFEGGGAPDPAEIRRIVHAVRASRAAPRVLATVTVLANRLQQVLRDLPRTRARGHLLQLVRATSQRACDCLPRDQSAVADHELPAELLDVWSGGGSFDRRLAGLGGRSVAELAAGLISAPGSVAASRGALIDVSSDAGELEERAHALCVRRLALTDPGLPALLDRVRAQEETPASSLTTAAREASLPSDQRIRLVAAAQLLEASGRCQFALAEATDPVSDGAAGAILVGDLFLCEFMGLLSELPVPAARHLGSTATAYWRALLDTHAEDRSAAMR